MFEERKKLYKELEKEYESKVLVYVTGDRRNLSSIIAPDVIDSLINQLNNIGVVKKISLYLYTRGGDTSAAWNIVNLLRMYCDQLQVIVPHKAHSAGTIITLGADEIVMTKQATLSPIDPNINTPINPKMPNQSDPLPVSVEAVKGYLEFAKEELDISDDASLKDIYLKLSEAVHPLVLGQVYRSRAQIQMLAEKLLVHQFSEEEKVKKVISFLCSDSGSHDYTINRREAKSDLELNIITPSDNQYTIINEIYENIYSELQLGDPFDFEKINGQYSARRCLLESIDGGSDYFASEGTVLHGINKSGQPVIQEKRTFEGWRHDEEKHENIKMNEGGEIEYESTNEFQM